MAKETKDRIWRAIVCHGVHKHDDLEFAKEFFFWRVIVPSGAGFAGLAAMVILNLFGVI